jgi:hypothetical protein
LGQGRLSSPGRWWAGLPSAPEMSCAPGQLRLVPQGDILLARSCRRCECNRTATTARGLFRDLQGEFEGQVGKAHVLDSKTMAHRHRRSFEFDSYGRLAPAITSYAAVASSVRSAALPPIRPPPSNRRTRSAAAIVSGRCAIITRVTCSSRRAALTSCSFGHVEVARPLVHERDPRVNLVFLRDVVAGPAR